MLLAVLFCICLTSCGDDIEVDTEVKYTVYENEGSDMISFYMSSDVNQSGEWEYSLSEIKCFDVFYESAEEKSNASYKTLILKPNAETEEAITIGFTLTESDGRQEFKVSVKKDENGILRITVDDTD